MAECAHVFRFQGVYYTHDEWPMPGTGAHQRYYHDVYFCERCLTTERRNPRAWGNSYEAAMPNTHPAEGRA